MKKYLLLSLFFVPLFAQEEILPEEETYETLPVDKEELSYYDGDYDPIDNKVPLYDDTNSILEKELVPAIPEKPVIPPVIVPVGPPAPKTFHKMGNPLVSPYTEFTLFYNKLDDTHLLTFRTNNSVFLNTQGIYHVNFSFYKDNKRTPSKRSLEINLNFQTPKQISPYYSQGQKLKLIMLGNNNKKRWEKTFTYDNREATYKYQKKTHHLKKYITIVDREQIYDILDSNQFITFYIEGLMGTYQFTFSPSVVAFYREFFEYAQEQGFYE